MPLSPGTRLNSHEIIEFIGAGGMGEVYRARDTKLERDVALKVLPDVFASDPDRMARFQREAKVLASLNHPNIAAIYGVEERALAMELVEGEMLSGPLPAGSAIDYARQMAEALEYAHEHGIVHRDLKPANVKVTPEGVVKLLDFGLARAIEDPSTAGDSVNSPTLTMGATRAGVILGTAGYMSPEQANGKTADRRADIWSFGAVLYEILTGKRAFEGESVADTLAAVLKLEPDWAALPADTPPAVRTLLQRCLTKDRKERLQAIGEARIVLRKPLAGDLAPAPATAPSLSQLGIAGRIVAGIIAAFAGTVLWGWLRPAPAQPRPVTHFTAALPQVSRATGVYMAISRDGSHIAFKRTIGSGPIYVRSMDEPMAKPIPGTEDALAPEFSPDGQWIIFFAYSTGGRRQLKKMPFAGGGAFTLVNDIGPGTPWLSWEEDGNILFSRNEGLSRIPAAGGKPEMLAAVDGKKGEFSYAAPRLLPGGKEVLLSIATNLEGSDMRIATLNLKTGEKKTLLESAGIGRYLPSEPGSESGYIVYARAGSLFAAAFDVNRLRAGSPVPVLEGVRTIGFNGQFTLSNAGALAYLPGGEIGGTSTMMWVDRQGVEQPLGAPPRNYSSLRMSPDGERLVVRINPGAIWVYDLARGSLTPIALEKNNSIAVWTQDGKRLLYLSSSNAAAIGSPVTGELVSIPSDGSRSSSLLIGGGPAYFPASVSPDGKVAMGYRNPGGGGRGSGSEIWVMPLAEGASRGANPQTFLESQYTISGGQFSPDGRWVSYQSTESGVSEIYVVPYPGPGARIPISTDGGSTARWARSGRELFYRNGGKMMTVDIQTSPVFRAGKPRMLFEKATMESPVIYDVAPDGSRFLMLKSDRPAVQAAQPDELHVVLNWTEALRRRVPPEK